MTQETPEQKQASTMTAIKEIVSRIKPVSDAEERKWTLENEIYPSMAQLGFSPRFRKELTVNQWDNAQREVYELVSKTLCGNGAIVALCGPRGIGKTTIAAQLAIARLWEHREFFRRPSKVRGGLPGPRLVLYRKLMSISNSLKPVYSDAGTINAEDLLAYRNQLCEAGVLVIDEKHDGNALTTADRILTDIIDRRYSNNMDTIIISNEDAKGFEKNTNASIVSRLNHHGGTIPCNWRSFRE
jgi:DNA replication protein DnaC